MGDHPIPILFDPRTHGFPTPWHNDPRGEAAVQDILAKLPVKRFVETGSHCGWTDMWMAHHYPDLPIFTVEIDTLWAWTAAWNTSPFRNVKCTQGDSVVFMEQNFEKFNDGLTLFLLDAHFLDVVPLREEIRILMRMKQFAAVIDDYWCWAPDWGGDTFEGTPEKPGDKNCLAYLKPIIGDTVVWRPNYEPRGPWHKGYGLIFKGCEGYRPPEYLREDTIP